jgi:hypothetical protein
MAKLEGDEGECVAAIAHAKQVIGEANLHIINVRNTFQQEIAAKLHDAQTSVAELRDKLRAQKDVLRRMAIRAP